VSGIGDFGRGVARVVGRDDASTSRHSLSVFGPLASDVADIERGVVALPAHHAME
jgi:hypothetical protein